MDGVHDLGGLDGFGPVEVRPEEPVFHAQWERRAFAHSGVLIVNGLATTSSFRHAIERMDPAHYLSSPYYEHWATATATLLVEAGVTTPDELERVAGGRVPFARPTTGTGVDEGEGTSYTVGAKVRVRETHPRGHTRCPRYVQGRVGTVVRVDRAFAVPDVEAHSPNPPHEPTYCIRFDAVDLWGEAAPAATSVHVDLWERYLEPVS